MRAEPPWRGDDEVSVPPVRRRPPPGQRCPYLEQILRERAAFGLLTRFLADCHVDHRTHRFTGRHPVPPCLGDFASCRFYQKAWSDESHMIDRYRD